ncbi:hypothetical protein D3C75_587840 [compost metagenome]
MKVEMVSRTLGRHKGEAAILLCDAQMISRAVSALIGIAGSMNIDTTAMSQDIEYVTSTVLDNVMNNMETPAIDLMSDFRDSYTAPRNRIVEVELTDKATQTKRLFGIIPSLTREGSATVRVSRIDVKAMK